MFNLKKTWIKLMNFGSKMGCHQMPERSFFIKGHQFPVCARCSGAFLGEVIAVLLILLRININFIWATALLFVMGADWFLQYVNLIESNNTRRLITGISGGLGLSFMSYNLFVMIFCMLKNFVSMFPHNF